VQAYLRKSLRTFYLWFIC